MSRRLKLHELLLEICPNVYFQPPETIKMKYPCVVYRRSGMSILHADNKPYTQKKRYSITVIDKDPDSELPDKIAELPTVTFDRHFTFENLNHDVFNIFY